METDDVPTPRGALVPSAPLTNDAPRSDVSSSPPPPKLPALTLQRPSNPYEPGQLPPIAPLHPINFSPFRPEVRRGSITDPSLHASSPTGAFKRNSPNGAEGGGSTAAATVAGTTPTTSGSAAGPLRELPVQQPPPSSGTVPPPLYAPSPLSGWHPAIAASTSAWPPPSQPPPLPGQLHSRLPFPARSASISPTSHARPTPSAGDASSFASYRMGEPVSPRTASPSTTLPSLCSQASLKRADSGGRPPSRPWTPDQVNSSGSAGAGSSTDSRIRTPDDSAQGGGGRPDDDGRKGSHPASEQRDRLTHQLPQFDFSQRRHSIALGYSLPSSSSLSQGTLPPPPSWSSQSPQVALKRKMSHDRAMHTPLHHSSTSSPTTGSPGASGGGNPSVPSPLAEGGPLKRRGSAFDTKMTSLSLMDSNPPASHDGSGRTIPPLSARGAPGNGGWLADRRDSTASLWSNASSTGGGYGSTQTSYTTGGGGSGSEFGGGSKSYAPPSGSATSGFPNAYAWSAPPSGPQQAPSGGLISFEAPSSGAAQSSSRSGSPTNGHALPRAPVGDAPMTSVKSHSPSSSASPLGAGAPASSSFVPGHHREATQGSASSSGSHLAPPPVAGATESETPYSRSPELRVSHKLAERKRRKEMKELFDELRDQLPADRGMKASKWEILSKAVDYISLIKSSNDAKNREIDQLRRELEAARVGSVNGGGRSHHQPPGILAHGGQPHSIEGYAPPPMMLGGPGPPTSAYLSGPYGYHHPPPPPSQQSSVRSSYAPVSDR